MKITLINTNDNGGGAAVACLRIAKALNQYTEVEACVLVQDKNTQNKQVVGIATSWWQRKMAFARFVAERVYFFFFEKNKAIRWAFNPARFGIDISQHPLIQQADVLHIHWTNFGFLSIDTFEKLLALGKPVVWTLHDMWAFTGGCHHSGNCEGYQQNCGNCKFLQNASSNDLSYQILQAKKENWAKYPNLTIVTCSQWLGNRASHSSLFQNHKIVAIPNPIDISIFKPYSKTEARQRLGLDPSKNYILFAAMKVTAIGKGFQYLKEALALQPLNNTELLVFGSANTSDFEELPLPVHALGRLSDPNQIALVYSAASVFVIPSLEENLPNTIMESLACATPVVGFEVGGIPEMIAHQHNGYLAKYKSATDLAAGILWVLQCADYEQIAQNALQKVLNEYQEKVVAQRYEAIYHHHYL